MEHRIGRLLPKLHQAQSKQGDSGRSRRIDEEIRPRLPESQSEAVGSEGAEGAKRKSWSYHGPVEKPRMARDGHVQMTADKTILQARIDKIKFLSVDQSGSDECFEAASLAQALLHDTVGGSHPLMAELQHSLQSSDYLRAVAASRAVASLWD